MPGTTIYFNSAALKDTDIDSGEYAALTWHTPHSFSFTQNHKEKRGSIALQGELSALHPNSDSCLLILLCVFPCSVLINLSVSSVQKRPLAV